MIISVLQMEKLRLGDPLPLLEELVCGRLEM